MECRAWLERVAEELARRRIPLAARERLMAELRDHAADLAEAGFFSTRTKEGSEMTIESMVEAKLGGPSEVAALAESEARRGGWVRRHPLLVFGLAPLPMAVLALILADVPALLTVWALGGLPYWVTVWAMVAVAEVVTPFVPFVLAGAWLGRLSRRGVSRAWLVVGVGQLALVAGALVSAIRVGGAPGESSWGLALGWPLGEVAAELLPLGGPPPLTWPQAPQFAAPLVAAWWGSRKKRSVKCVV